MVSNKLIFSLSFIVMLVFGLALTTVTANVPKYKIDWYTGGSDPQWDITIYIAVTAANPLTSTISNNSNDLRPATVAIRLKTLAVEADRVEGMDFSAPARVVSAPIPLETDLTTEVTNPANRADVAWHYYTVELVPPTNALGELDITMTLPGYLPVTFGAADRTGTPVNNALAVIARTDFVRVPARPQLPSGRSGDPLPSVPGPPLDTLSAAGQIGFSELMFTPQDDPDALPEWIELYNNSKTQAVNLKGWRLEVEGRDTTQQHRRTVVHLRDLVVPAGQTALIVTATGETSVDIPSGRVYDFFRHHSDFQVTNTRNKLLGSVGFFLKLSDPGGKVSDVVGNLDGNAETSDSPDWALPSVVTADGSRTSLLRRYEPLSDKPLAGRMLFNWRRAVDAELPMRSYWGKETDIGNPGSTDQGKIEFIPPLMSFSEVMLTSRGGLHSLPQWVELENASATETVNLQGWSLKIESRDAEDVHRYGEVTFKELLIPPGEKALLVTSWGRHSRSLLPKDRIYTISASDAFGARDHRAANQVFGPVGFFLKLSDREGVIRDLAGNLDGRESTSDRPKWELPSGETAEGFRTSLVRRYFSGTTKPLDGKSQENWVRAADIGVAATTYWGKQTDIGTPGSVNADRQASGDPVDFSESPISFSELMLTSRGGLHSLPQWIEISNASETVETNLRGWTLEVESRDAEGVHRYGMMTFTELLIPANGTALLVTWRGRSSQEIIGDGVYYVRAQDVFSRGGHQVRNQLLGGAGFFLKLSDADGVVRDIAGNLDGDKMTADAPQWELPSGKTGEGFRSSLMRRHYHLTGIPLDGQSSENWVSASNLPLTVKTYWGRETDLGNPGHKGGGPLPVALASFRSERADTGHVVIKWTTASEKDNAGFNILRGQQRQGRFVRLNPKLLPGGGTRSERSSYTWTDTTAKVDVVYYYRLEDVSFSGEHRQLATVRLRGDISAKGKLTTRWSDLKQEE
ncbi:MAG: lamin tail domain-containing protein [Candidatus Poribacteria bacterium]|nr:lamin tail domain-containing protein [Candidatus Poribacteria bacterium]